MLAFSEVQISLGIEALPAESLLLKNIVEHHDDEESLLAENMSAIYMLGSFSLCFSPVLFSRPIRGHWRYEAEEESEWEIERNERLKEREKEERKNLSSFEQYNTSQRLLRKERSLY